MKQVAVVILNWNGKHLLQQFLPSVINNSPEAIVYIADNCSSDGSVTFLEKNFPEVKIIPCPDNYGFAGGYNYALKYVSEEIYILLNSDVEVCPGWIPPLLSKLNSDTKIAACQPKIKDQRNKNLFEYAGAAGGFIDKYGYPYCKGRIFNTLEEDHGQYNEDTEIFWASGACMAVRKKAFQEVEGFDLHFFAHMEEIDFCWRLKNRGYKISYCSTSQVYHVGGATLSKGNPKKTYLNFRNNLLMLIKNLKAEDFIKVIPARLVLDGIAGVKFLMDGQMSHTLAVIKAHFYCYLKWNSFKNKERNQRKRNLKEFKEVYQNSIVWQYFVSGNKTFKNLKNPK